MLWFLHPLPRIPNFQLMRRLGQHHSVLLSSIRHLHEQRLLQRHIRFSPGTCRNSGATSSCSKLCQGLIGAIKSTGCLDGDIGALVRKLLVSSFSSVQDVPLSLLNFCPPPSANLPPGQQPSGSGGNCQNANTGKYDRRSWDFQR